MGTNYYWRNETNKCEHCNRSDLEEIHIGKSSVGWTFSFHATEEIRSWKDWQEKIASGGYISDEYGRRKAPEEFRQIVENHPNGLKNFTEYSEVYFPEDSERLWKDEDGHSFSLGEFS